MEFNRKSSIDVQRLVDCIRKTAVEMGTTCEGELRRQVRLLASDIVRSSPPVDRQKTYQAIDRMGAMLFYPLPFPNMIGVAKKSKPDGTLWLYASPRFLVGVSREKYNLDISARTIALARKGGTRMRGERKWIDAGSRGMQRVMILNKRVVRPTSLTEGMAIAKSNVGKLKGAWIGAGLNLGLAVDGPDWAAKHATDGHGYGYLEGRFTMVIGSRARGVGGERSLDAIHWALRGRAAKAAKDLKNQLQGLYKRAGFSAHQ